MDIDIIFKIAGIGIVVTVINQVLKKSDREDMATMVTIAGIIVVLMLVVDMINSFFETVKTLFSLY